MRGEQHKLQVYFASEIEKRRYVAALDRLRVTRNEELERGGLAKKAWSISATAKKVLSDALGIK